MRHNIQKHWTRVGGGRVETAENQCFSYLLMMTNHKHKNFPAILLIEAKKLEDNLGTPGTTVDTRQAEFSKIRGNRSHSQGWYLASVLQANNSPASKWTCISWALGQSLLGPVTATHPLNLSQILPLTCLLDLALPSSSACLSILVFFQAMSNLKSWYLNSSLAALVVGKESTCNAEDPSLIPGSGRSTEEGIGYPLGLGSFWGLSW